MKKKSEKKLVSFTNLELINRLVGDEAAVKNVSESYIIEQRLLASYTPSSEDLAFQAIHRLYSRLQLGNEIQEALYGLFSYCSIPMRNFPFVEHTDLQDIVKFMQTLDSEPRNLKIYTTDPKPDDSSDVWSDYGCYDDLLKALDSIASLFEYLREEELRKDENEIDYIYTEHLQAQASTMRRILKRWKIAPAEELFSLMYSFILTNWQLLCKYSFTYTALCLIAKMSTWTNTPAARVDLLRLINELDQRWMIDEKIRQREERKGDGRG